MTIYYNELKWDEWYFFTAATTKGICYVSTEQTRDEHIAMWLAPHSREVRRADSMEILAIVHEQLSEYIQGNRTEFDVSLHLFGTPFQYEVWAALRKIPYGQTTTYSAIAQAINRPKATRAVASAIGRNPVPIIVPCHRVIRKDGTLGGFREGLEMKKRLFAIEEIN